MFARLLHQLFPHPAEKDLDRWADDLAAERRWRASRGGRSPSSTGRTTNGSGEIRCSDRRSGDSQAVLYVGGMYPASMIAVALEAVRIGDCQLAAKHLKDFGEDLSRLVRQNTHEVDRSQQGGIAQTVVTAPQPLDEFAVFILQVEVAFQLFATGDVDIATKAFALLLRQKADRHRSQSLDSETGRRDDPGTSNLPPLQQAGRGMLALSVHDPYFFSAAKRIASSLRKSGSERPSVTTLPSG